MYINKAIVEMKNVFKDVPYGIEHSLKVLKNAESIMAGEDMAQEDKELISIVAILHDIGAMEAQRKYGAMDGSFQEMEGPPIAQGILNHIGYDSNKIDRVCYIVGNHHTPSKIDGLDFQIQWEADLLENLAYLNIPKDQEAIKRYIEENFKTKIGRKLAYERFIIA